MGSANSRSRDCSVRCLNNLSNVGPSSKHSLPFLLQAAALSRTDVIHSMKMLRDERTGGLVTLLRCIRHTDQRRLRAVLVHQADEARRIMPHRRKSAQSPKWTWNCWSVTEETVVMVGPPNAWREGLDRFATDL
jgi:hypothetical protein